MQTGVNRRHVAHCQTSEHKQCRRYYWVHLLYKKARKTNYENTRHTTITQLRLFTFQITENEPRFQLCFPLITFTFVCCKLSKTFFLLSTTDRISVGGNALCNHLRPSVRLSICFHSSSEPTDR